MSKPDRYSHHATSVAMNGCGLSLLATLLLLTLAACAQRPVAHLDPGDADPDTVRAVEDELKRLGFRVAPLDERAREAGPNRLIYGFGIDVEQVIDRLQTVLGGLLQAAPTVRGTHVYNSGHMGVYLARASDPSPREFNGECGKYFARALLWPAGAARLRVQAWDENQGAYRDTHQLDATWQEHQRLRLLEQHSDALLAEQATQEPDARYQPPLMLYNEPFSSTLPCPVFERQVPNSLPANGIHRSRDADRR